MDSEKILERMKDIYQQSVSIENHGQNMQTDLQSQSSSDSNQSIHNRNSHFIEIDGNCLLFFNDIYTSKFSKFIKNILKKVAWPILKRQIYFNSAIRQLLYNLVQKSYEDSVKAREVNEKITQLEQTIEKLSTEIQYEDSVKARKVNEKITQLEQTIEKLSTEIQYEDSVKAREVNEKITQLEQIIEKLSTEIQTDNSNTNSFVASETAKMRSGLWFNEPIIIGYSGDGEAYWAVTNERIVEKTFVIHSLAHFCNSKKIELLDVGAAESLLSYELASFNYSVTAIDIRPIALSHPNLKFVKSDICQAVFSPASFDCVIALSTLEHLGLGWYGDEKINSYDLEAVKQINLLLKSEGIFILTVPYGRKAITPVHRIYDQESLQKLTQDFTVMQISYGVRKDSFTWTITENELEASVQEHNPDNYLPGAVAMLVCKKKS